MHLFKHDPHRDKKLINNCLSGHGESWNQLVELYAALVHSIPVKHGLTPAEAEDVAQETFLALAQHLHQLENQSALPAWLMTTARRLSWRMVQKSKGSLLLEEDALASVADSSDKIDRSSRMPTMSELLALWESQELIAQGFQALGERCRTLLTLIFLDAAEPSYDDISQQLGISKGSIGPTRNRCLNQLHDILIGLGYE